MGFSVLLDANVLYPAYLRDVILRFAYAGVFQVHWTDQILHEMSRNIKSKVPEERHDRVDRTLAQMREAFPEAMVKGHERLIESMTNHPKDRHVLAAAVVEKPGVSHVHPRRLGRRPSKSAGQPGDPPAGTSVQAGPHVQ